ncbi:MAG TPA: D-alanyl-D-alanine carboxypeptidase family protein [Candidatus Binataceae bacterium]
MNSLLLSAAGSSRRSRVATIVAVAVLGAAVALPPDALAARRHHAAAASATSAPAASGAEPQGDYTEACVLEPVSNPFIFERNDDAPWPTASLAKMMVMLIVAEKLHDGSLKLTDQVATSRAAAKMGGSQVYLKEGETFSLDDTMKAIAVHSANDSTVAVAEYIAGSADAFVQMMNQKAAALGMKNTHYYFVHGLPPGPGQQADVSSAHDEAVLGRELVKYPDVLRWTSITTAPFRNGTFLLQNTNHLVFTYKGCDGLKTGFYDKAGFNVVATAKRGDLRLIAVVLGTVHKPANFRTAGELMSQGFLNYEMRSIAKKGSQVPQTVAVIDGTAPSLKPVFGGDAEVFTKRDDDSKSARALKVAYNLPPSVTAPVKAGQQIGTAKVTQDGKPVATVALLAPASVPRETSIVKRLLSRF